MMTKKNILFLTCYMIAAILCLMINSTVVYVSALIAAWIHGFIYSLKRLRNRFTLFSFYVGFLVFLMGGMLVSWANSGDFSYFPSSPEAVRHTCLCLFLTIAVINISTLFVRSGKTESSPRLEPSVRPGDAVPQAMRYIIIGLLIVGFGCELLVEIRTTMVIRATTYALSMSVNVGLPSIIIHMASLYYIALFMYWALMPSRRGVYLSSLSLLLIEGIILLSGERGEPISMCFVLIYNILIRNKLGYDDIRIRKGWVLAGLMLIPFILFGLQTLSYTRVNREYNSSVVESMNDFAKTQGGTVKIIAEAYDKRDTISDIGGHSFVLGTVRSYLKNNVFTRILFGSQGSGKRDVEDAYSGNSFLNTYGYVHSAYTYSKGVGGGSTYIAEVFQDGGYLFLIAFNAFLGWLFAYIDRNIGYGVIRTTILMNIFRYMMLLPRGVALQWLISTFAIQNILLFLVYVFLHQGVRKKERYNW